MKLHEYQSKRVFATFGIPVPMGEVTDSAELVRRIAETYGGRVVIKAQVRLDGRSKLNRVKMTHAPDEAEAAARHLLGMRFKGVPVQQLLIEPAVTIDRAFSLAIMIDRSLSKPVLIASTRYGVGIEIITSAAPETVWRIPIDPLLGLLDFQARDLGFELGLERRSINSFVQIAQSLYQVFIHTDASLVEINPLAVDVHSEGELIAIDARMDLDDNALFRHQDLIEPIKQQADDEIEHKARLAGLSYIKLDGDVGSLVNGAGLAMATVDMITAYGGRPANFLDIGGGADAERVAVALRLILANPKVKSILLNIFGGITRCDEVARGILTALGEVKPDVPIVVRLAGTNEAQGQTVLAEADLPSVGSLAEAIRKVVNLAEGAWAI